MDWIYATIWHRAEPAALAAFVDACAERLHQLDPTVRLALVDAADGDPGAKSLRRSWTRGEVQRRLETLGAVVLAHGTDPDAPEVEVVVTPPFWRGSHAREVRYQPAGRTSVWNLRGAVMVHWHGTRREVRGARRMLEVLVSLVPRVEAAALHTTRLKRVLAALPDSSTSLPDGADELAVLPGVTMFLDRGQAEALLGTPEPEADVLARLGGQSTAKGVWFRVPGHADIDPEDPTHRTWLAALAGLMPWAVGPAAHRAKPPPLPTGLAATPDGLVGKRLMRAQYLQHHRGPDRIDDGHGPVQLDFDDGTVVHTWPEANATLLLAGPLRFGPASWPHPSGQTDALRLEALSLAGVGDVLVAVEPEPHPRENGRVPVGWRFRFEGGATLRVENRSTVQSAWLWLGGEA